MKPEVVAAPPAVASYPDVIVVIHLPSSRPVAELADSNSDNNVSYKCNPYATNLLLFMFVIVAPIALIVVLAVHIAPRDPKFQVDSLTVSPLYLSTSIHQITANWSIEIVVRNPSKLVSFSYQSIEVSVLHNATEFLSKATSESFDVNPKSQKSIIVQPKAWFQSLSDSAAKAISEDRIDGVLDFDLKLEANLIRSDMDNPMNILVFDVFCRNLKVEFPSSAAGGSMLGGSKKCPSPPLPDDYY